MFKYSWLESVTIPASVTELGKEAFYECRKLRRVTFTRGSKLKKIKEACFMGTQIEEITIPDTVVVLEDYVF